MNADEIKEIFKQDEEGRFVSLIIPELDGMRELDLTGKTEAELNSEEVSRLKIYLRELKRIAE